MSIVRAKAPHTFPEKAMASRSVGFLGFLTAKRIESTGDGISTRFITVAVVLHGCDIRNWSASHPIPCGQEFSAVAGIN